MRAEFRAGERIAEELRAAGASVTFQETPVCPDFIPRIVNLTTTVYTVSVLLYLFAPLFSFLLITPVLAGLVLMRSKGNHVIDWLFPRKTTRNVIATFRPAREPKEVLIFSGHHDSPNMMPLLWPPWKRHVHRIEKAFFLGAAVLVPASALRAFRLGPVPGFPVELGWPDLLFLVSLAGLAANLFYRWKILSPERNLGANDNLSAVAVLLGIADFLKDHPPQRTEIHLVSFGAEEPLIYGSAGFAKAFPDLISRAINVNMETLGAGRLAVIEREEICRLSYTPEVVERIRRAGRRAGIDLPAVRVSYGGTDSRAIVKAGGRSACLFGMDEWGLFSLWHHPDDHPANISEENLKQALRICVEVIRESEGLSG